MRTLALLALVTIAGCGSGLVGPAAPGLDSPAVFGHYTDGELAVGWLLVTDDKVPCNKIVAVTEKAHTAGGGLWIALEKGPSLPWEGLYPGTFAAYPDPDVEGETTPEGRHAEVYFQADQDVAVLTGNDVWVWIDEYDEGTLLRAVLQTELAEGIVVARDCGEIEP